MERKNLVDALNFGRDYVRAANLNRPQTVNSFSTIFAVIDTSYLQPEAQTQTISISGLIQSAIDDGLISPPASGGSTAEVIGSGEPYPSGMETGSTLWVRTDEGQYYEYVNDGGSWYPQTITSANITASGDPLTTRLLTEFGLFQPGEIRNQDNLNRVFAQSIPVPFEPAEPEHVYKGRFWYDTIARELLLYDGNNWIELVGSGQFVNKFGSDTMEGPLQVTGPRSVNSSGIESTVKVLNVDSGENSSLNLKHNGATQIYVGNTQTSFQGDIKFNVSGRAIYAGSDKKGFVINDNGAFYEGNYSVDKHVATKKNVEEAIYDDILDTDTNKYVDRTGDSMSGPLVMDNTEVRFNNRSDGQTLIRAGRNDAEFPVLLDLRNPGGAVVGGYDIKIQGNTAYNQLRFVGSDTYLTMNGGGGAPDRVMFNIDISLENNRIKNLGRAVNDTDAVPYGQIEEELAEFRDELISNLTFGAWQYASGSVNPVTGRCYFRSSGGQNSGIAPNQVAQMIFNVTDITGAIGAFDRIDIGEIISLTNGTVTIKYKVNSAASTSGSDNSTRTFDVNYISQTGPQTFIDGIQWTFTLTEFTDISVDQLDDTYLRLDCSNDPLETELEIKTPDYGEAALTLHGKRDNVNNATATVAFKNQIDTNEAYAGYLTYRTTGRAAGYFRFNQDVDLSNKGLHSVAQVRMQSDGYIGSGKEERIKIRDGTGADAGTEIQRIGDGKRTFAIKGKADGSNALSDIFYAYGNNLGDAINYTGIITAANHIVNKAYVDSKSGGVDITCDATGKTKGDMWYCATDGALYIKVS